MSLRKNGVTILIYAFWASLFVFCFFRQRILSIFPKSIFFTLSKIIHFAEFTVRFFGQQFIFSFCFLKTRRSDSPRLYLLAWVRQVRRERWAKQFLFPAPSFVFYITKKNHIFNIFFKKNVDKAYIKDYNEIIEITYMWLLIYNGRKKWKKIYLFWWSKTKSLTRQ